MGVSKCRECGKDFGLAYNLSKHVRTFHPGGSSLPDVGVSSYIAALQETEPNNDCDSSSKDQMLLSLEQIEAMVSHNTNSASCEAEYYSDDSSRISLETVSQVGSDVGGNSTIIISEDEEEQSQETQNNNQGQQTKDQQAKDLDNVFVIPPTPTGNRRCIWSGTLKWAEKSRSLTEDRLSTRFATCHIISAIQSGNVEVSASAWPKTLVMQIVSKTNIASLGTSVMRNSKCIWFIPQVPNGLHNVLDVMRSGSTFIIHIFIGNKVIVLCEDKGSIVGCLLADPIDFMNRLRKLTQIQTVSENLMFDTQIRGRIFSHMAARLPTFDVPGSSSTPSSMSAPTGPQMPTSMASRDYQKMLRPAMTVLGATNINQYIPPTLPSSSTFRPQGYTSDMRYSAPSSVGPQILRSNMVYPSRFGASNVTTMCNFNMAGNRQVGGFSTMAGISRFSTMSSNHTTTMGNFNMAGNRQVGGFSTMAGTYRCSTMTGNKTTTMGNFNIAGNRQVGSFSTMAGNSRFSTMRGNQMTSNQLPFSKFSK